MAPRGEATMVDPEITVTYKLCMSITTRRPPRRQNLPGAFMRPMDPKQPALANAMVLTEPAAAQRPVERNAFTGAANRRRADSADRVWRLISGPASNGT